MHCQTSIPSSKKQGKGEDTQPNSLPESEQSHCAGEGGTTDQKRAKICVVFCHEDFGRQLVWVLQRYMSIDIEGPSATFFEVKQQQTSTGAAGGATGQQQQANQQDNGDASHQQQQQQEIENDLLPTAIQEIMDRGGVNLDSDDVETAARELPMVDDDNEPAPENCPTPGAGADAHIFSGWEHSGVCCR